MAAEIITKEMLEERGFEDVSDEYERSFWASILAPDVYVCMMIHYDGLSISLNNRSTNSDECWNVHIDNSDSDSIASIELSTTEQFNMLMKIIKSDFRL